MNQAGVPAVLLCTSASAQWLDYPNKDIPRTKDGEPNLTAPAPRLPDGKPDLAGLWVADNSRQLGNLAADLKEVPFQPWAEKLVDTEMLEFVCEENVDPEYLVGKGTAQ